MNKSFPEVKLSYSNPLPVADRVKVMSPSDAIKYLREVWEDIHYRERFFVVLMNRNNHVLGYFLVSIGGISGTVIDVRLILQAALLANACSMIIAHNHPSGNLIPSGADKEITQKIKEAAKMMDITLLDHVIVTSEGEFSFANEGLL